MTSSAPDNPLYETLRAQLESGVQFLLDKPEETVDNTLHAQWYRAADHCYSAGRALEQPLPEPDSAQQASPRELVKRRVEGTPLSSLTGRQQFIRTTALLHWPAVFIGKVPEPHTRPPEAK